MYIPWACKHRHHCFPAPHPRTWWLAHHHQFGVGPGGVSLAAQSKQWKNNTKLRCGLNRKGDRQNEGWGDLTVCLTRYILSLFICTSTGVVVHRSRLDSFACLKQQIPTILSWLCHHLTMITQHNRLICVFKEFFSVFWTDRGRRCTFYRFSVVLLVIRFCKSVTKGQCFQDRQKGQCHTVGLHLKGKQTSLTLGVLCLPQLMPAVGEMYIFLCKNGKYSTP